MQPTEKGPTETQLTDRPTESQPTETQPTHSPCGQDGVLGVEPVNGAILQAKGNHSATLAPLHDEVQGKVLNEVVAVVLQGLHREIGKSSKKSVTGF